MAKDFSYQFYPGDVLRQTQFFTHAQKGCYLDVLTSHIENIRFSYVFLTKITSHLNIEEKEDFLKIFEQDESGYFIPWVVLAIKKRADYIESRSKNKSGKTKNKRTKKKKSYENHMENKYENKYKEEIEDRDNVFKAELSKFFDTYGKDMCREFYNYWSERNKQGTKMKFELQKTWELSKRLKTWAENQKQFKGKQNGKSANEESRERLLRESLNILNS